MYCPKCKCEYVDGIIECVDCHVKLVYELPPEPKEEKEQENIYRTDINVDMTYIGMYHDSGSAGIAKDFLEENGIKAIPIEYRFDKITRLYVGKEDAQRAEKLLKEFLDTTVDDSREETEKEMETENEEPVKNKFWQFTGKIRQFYIRISWLFLGIIWVLLGLYLTAYEKKYFHGPALIALGTFITVYVIRKWYHSNKQNKTY